MELKVEKVNESLTVYINGRLDTVAASSFQDDLFLAIGNENKIILDCSDLSYICSPGLRVFIALYKKMAVAGSGTINIRNVQPVVKEVFDLMNFSEIFHFI